MKTGRSITELAQELEKQAAGKSDMIVDTRSLEMTSNGDLKLFVKGGDGGGGEMGKGYSIRPHALRQIHSRVGIPAKYADKMIEEAPELYARNINHWFENNLEERMVRLMNGEVRAFLSNRYQRIDNIEIAEVVLPVLAELAPIHGLEIVSCEVTEAKLYIKAVAKKIEGEGKIGDIMQAGVVITNSEVGLGAVGVCPMLLRLVCLNGMMVNDAKFRKHHLGTNESLNGATYKMLSDEAIEADDKAVLLKVRDVVRGALDREAFDQNLRRVRDASENKITGNPVKAIEVLSNNYQLNKDEQGGVLRHLIEGGDLSQWGTINAFTRYSQDVEDYDRASEFENIGGKILDLAPNEWKTVAVAA